MEPVDEEVVSIRRLPEDDLNVREVRISCPDATGLGVDLTRVLLDFGLRILAGDISTDGKWCFMVFRVQLSSGVPPRWQLLRSRLCSMCPSGAGLGSLWRWRSLPKEQPAFLLQVASYDRRGMLHSLAHVLWEADAAVFKAHITTSPSGDVADMFWLYDNRNELPENHRALEICDRVKGVLGSDTECSISPAPLDSIADTPTLTRRKACKDAVSFSNLRSIVSKRRAGSGSRAERARSLPAALAAATWDDEAAGDAGGGGVTLVVDNETSPSYTMLTLSCADRKGLLYDILRALKDVDLRVAYGRLEVDEGAPGGRAQVAIDLFIQDNDLCRINDPEALQEVRRRVELAVTLPVRISLRDVFDGCCTELLVSAPLDTGGRGRPRVTFDVTQALSLAGLGVFMADVFIESAVEELDDYELAQERHRFLIHLPNGQPIRSEHDKKAVYDVVKAQLLGSRLELAPLGPHGKLAAVRASSEAAVGGGGLYRVPSELHELPSTLLQSLDNRWQFGVA